MELTPDNTPKITIGDLKKQNALWRKRVTTEAKKMSDEQLAAYIAVTEDLLDRTTNIAIGITERERLRLLNEVMAKRENKRK